MLPQWEIDGSGQVVLGVLLAGQDLDPAAQMLTVNFPRQGYLLTRKSNGSLSDDAPLGEGPPLLGGEAACFAEVENSTSEATFLGPALCQLGAGEKVAVRAPLLVHVLTVVPHVFM